MGASSNPSERSRSDGNGYCSRCVIHSSPQGFAKSKHSIDMRLTGHSESTSVAIDPRGEVTMKGCAVLTNPVYTEKVSSGFANEHPHCNNVASY